MIDLPKTVHSSRTGDQFKKGNEKIPYLFTNIDKIILESFVFSLQCFHTVDIST